MAPKTRLLSLSLALATLSIAAGIVDPVEPFAANHLFVVDGGTSILEFDELVVAPRNGFDGAAAYYAACHARQFLGAIRVPTLVVHAQDDPWIPADAYTSFDWSTAPALVPGLAPSGGHVGFHAQGSRVPWHDRCLEALLQRL